MELNATRRAVSSVGLRDRLSRRFGTGRPGARADQEAPQGTPGVAADQDRHRPLAARVQPASAPGVRARSAAPAARARDALKRAPAINPAAPSTIVANVSTPT